MPIILLCGLALALGAIVTTPKATGSTTATYILQRVGSGSPIDDALGTTGPDPLAGAAAVAQSSDVAKLAAPKLKPVTSDDPQLLATQLSVAPSTAGTLAIAFTDPDSQKATAVANAFGDAVQEQLTKQNQAALATQLAAAKAQVSTIAAALPVLNAQIVQATPTPAPGQPAPPPSAKLQLLQAQQALVIKQYAAAYQTLQQLEGVQPVGSGFTTASRAAPVVTPASSLATSKPLRGAAGGLVGLILGAAIGFLLERLGSKLWLRQDVERAFQLPILAEIPVPRGRTSRKRMAAGELVSQASPNSPIGESYRALRSSIALLPKAGELSPVDSVSGATVGDGVGPIAPAAVRRSPRVIMVTSPGTGDGKTSTVANLAVCMAETNDSVLVLDADLRRPDIHWYLGAERVPGITDATATGTVPNDLDVLAGDTRAPGVRLLASGSPVANASDFVPLVAEVAGRAHEYAEIVLIDTPGIVASHDAIELLPHVEAVLLVARLGHTRKDGARRAREIMARTGAPAVGVVVVGSRPVSRRRSRYLETTGVLLQSPAAARRAKGLGPFSPDARQPSNGAPETTATIP